VLAQQKRVASLEKVVAGSTLGMMRMASGAHPFRGGAAREIDNEMVSSRSRRAGSVAASRGETRPTGEMAIVKGDVNSLRSRLAKARFMNHGDEDAMVFERWKSRKVCATRDQSMR